jgi:hypothetical protein
MNEQAEIIRKMSMPELSALMANGVILPERYQELVINWRRDSGYENEMSKLRYYSAFGTWRGARQPEHDHSRRDTPAASVFCVQREIHNLRADVRTSDRRTNKATSRKAGKCVGCRK